MSSVAQEDTARHREIYAEINAWQKDGKQVDAQLEVEEAEVRLNGYLDDGVLRKIVATLPGEHGLGTEEYYLEDGKLVFVYTHYTTEELESAKVVARAEDRYYFNDEVMFKWLDHEDRIVPADSEAFTEMATRLTADVASFSAALGKKQAAPAASRTTEGKFTGVEAGDYFHWNMETADGGKLSLFVLRPDASVSKVLEKPDAHVGKRCRVQWRESGEDIPESAGMMEVKQILSVEWLD